MKRITKHLFLFSAFCAITLIYLHAPPEAHATSVFFISNEVGGTLKSDREAVDILNSEWKESLHSAGSCGIEVGSIGDDGVGVAQFDSGFNIGVSLRDMVLGGYGYVASQQFTASSSATTTLQDGSPKPQSLYLGNYQYWNDVSGENNYLNAILFTFPEPLSAFGAWFGDLETRNDGLGKAAKVTIYNSSHSIIDSTDIVTSTADQSLCGEPVDSNYTGCGNQTTRWIGFHTEDPVVNYMLVTVGDDDSLSGEDNGNTEHLSFIGPSIARDFTCEEFPAIGVAKELTQLVQSAEGKYMLEFKILLKNYGNVQLKELSIMEDLEAFVGSSTIEKIVTESETLTVNLGFDGVESKELLGEGNTLDVEGTATLTITLQLSSVDLGNIYNNSVTATGVSPLNNVVQDNSTEGYNPDPNGDGNPDESNSTTVQFIAETVENKRQTEILGVSSETNNDSRLSNGLAVTGGVTWSKMLIGSLLLLILGIRWTYKVLHM